MLGSRLITAALFALFLLAPGAAWGREDEDDEDRAAATFAVTGTHGYRIIVYAQAGEPGEVGKAVVLAMHRSRERAALYLADAIVTPTSLMADLGPLGHINLQLARSGGERTVRDLCGGRTEIEKANYWGSFEFHGEQGFTDVSASRVAFNPIPYFRVFFCSQAVAVTTVSASPGPGAWLRGTARLAGRAKLAFEAVKNRPGGRALVRASIQERRQGITVVRAVGGFAGAASLEYDRGLRTATLDPPSPFAGSARFLRDGKRGRRWRGNLRIDLPGRANVALTRPDLLLRLRRGRYTVSEFSLDRPGLAGPLALLEAH